MITTWKPWTTDRDDKRILGNLTPPDGDVVLVDVDLFDPPELLFDEQGNILWSGLRNLEENEHHRLKTDDIRREAFFKIDTHPQTRFLLWTEHPERVRELWPLVKFSDEDTCRVCGGLLDENDECPGDRGEDSVHVRNRRNVLLYAAASRQAELDTRAPELLKLRDLCGGLGLLLNPVEALDLHKLLYVGDEGGWEYVGSKRNFYDSILVLGKSHPVHPENVRSLVEQCRAASVPCCFLSWGEWLPDEQVHQSHNKILSESHEASQRHIRVGREHSGNLLDGKRYLELPEVR